MRYAARTDMGRARDNNEDSYHGDGRVFIVADGMGGHQAGEIASAAAVEAFLRFEEDNRDLSPLERMREGMTAANLDIIGLAENDKRLEGMGTTFTAALVEGEVYIGHVGDSRAYLLRDGELALMTRDHSLVERMVREGRISRSEARRHPQRNVILRALGVSGELEVDLRSFGPLAGDRLLLCSDGLTGLVEDRELAGILSREKEPEDCCGSLIDAANRRGGLDNITVIVVDFEAGSRDVPEGGRRAKGRWRALFSRG